LEVGQAGPPDSSLFQNTQTCPGDHPASTQFDPEAFSTELKRTEREVNHITQAEVQNRWIYYLHFHPPPHNCLHVVVLSIKTIFRAKVSDLNSIRERVFCSTVLIQLWCSMKSGT